MSASECFKQYGIYVLLVGIILVIYIKNILLRRKNKEYKECNFSYNYFSRELVGDVNKLINEKNNNLINTNLINEKNKIKNINSTITSINNYKINYNDFEQLCRQNNYEKIKDVINNGYLLRKYIDCMFKYCSHKTLGKLISNVLIKSMSYELIQEKLNLNSKNFIRYLDNNK